MLFWARNSDSSFNSSKGFNCVEEFFVLLEIFILSLKEEDCRTLQELVSESEDTFLTVAEIQDMIKCSDFIRRLDVIKNEEEQNVQKEEKTDQELQYFHEFRPTAKAFRKEGLKFKV